MFSLRTCCFNSKFSSPSTVSGTESESQSLINAPNLCFLFLVEGGSEEVISSASLRAFPRNIHQMEFVSIV